MKKILTRIAQLLLVVVLCWFFPKFMLFFILCGIYDVSRNKPLTFALIDRYFFGNGVLTWICRRSTC